MNNAEHNSQVVSATNERQVVPVQMAALDTADDIYESARQLAMLTSYTGSPSVLLKSFVNRTLEVKGVCIVDVESHINRQTGEVQPGYRNILFKIIDPDSGRVVIARTAARQIRMLVEQFLLPRFGWFDWQQSLYMNVRAQDTQLFINFTVNR